MGRNERNETLEIMKEMKVESILATPFYERLLFYPWILTQALVAKLAIF